MRLNRGSDTGVSEAIPLLDKLCGHGHLPVCLVKITQVALGLGLVSEGVGSGRESVG